MGKLLPLVLCALSVAADAGAGDESYSGLRGVACANSTDCWAVGWNQAATQNDQPLFFHWNGTAWSLFPVPAVNGNAVLNGVTCTSATDCWAVGEQNGAAFTQRWNGTAWSIVTAPAPGAGSVLHRVTCAATNDCWAVGASQSGNRSVTLAMRWDGSSWAVVSVPNAHATYNNILRGVSCASSIDCWAVGDVTLNPWTFVPAPVLLARWNGFVWSLASAPVPSYPLLRDVDCLSSSNCWAAGGYLWDSAPSSLFQNWNGQSWTVDSTDHKNSTAMCGLSCSGPNDCWAVGDCIQGEFPLAKHWNGKGWTEVQVEFAKRPLEDVFCLGTNDCWAVGREMHNPLIEHWDGEEWSIVVSGLAGPSEVVSRKMHGNAGPYDVPLGIYGGPGDAECRSGGANGEYQVVFTFPHELVNVHAALVQAGSVTGAAIGPLPNQYTVNVAGIPNARYTNVHLNLVQDTAGHFENVWASLPALTGDTNNDLLVNAADSLQTRNRSGEPVSKANFRSDTNADGIVNSGDTLLVRSRSGSALP